MPAWPTLPEKATKILSLILFIIGFCIELVDIQTIYSQLNSHCIAGWQITEAVGLHLKLLSMIVIPDGVYILCICIALPLQRCGFGADPSTIVYNFFAAAFALYSMVPINSIEPCGNDAIPIVKHCGVTSIISGVVHLLNGAGCLLFLMPEERTIPSRRRNTTTSVEED